MPRKKEDSEEEEYEDNVKTKSKTTRSPRATVLRRKREDDEEEFKPNKKKKTSTKTRSSKKKRIESDEDEEEFEISEEEDEEEEEDWEEEERRKKKARTSKTKVKYVTLNTNFTINLQNGDLPTIDIVIGNYHNALEGACEENNISTSWLDKEPPKNKPSGTVIKRDVSMRIPALVGQWNVAHLRNKDGGCCGVFFWHSDHVGPDIQSSINLIREFSALGMKVFDNVESKQAGDKGLRLIGRYSWDYYREYRGKDNEVDEECGDLFDGPHCFFVPADHYKDSVFPEILKRSESGSKKGYKPYLTKIDENGALALFDGQEYMFAKIFLKEKEGESEGERKEGEKEWIGVRAMLVVTYDMGSEWADASVEDVPIVLPENGDGDVEEQEGEEEGEEEENNEESVKESEEPEESNPEP